MSVSESLIPSKLESELILLRLVYINLAFNIWQFFCIILKTETIRAIAQHGLQPQPCFSKAQERATVYGFGRGQVEKPFKYIACCLLLLMVIFVYLVMFYVCYVATDYFTVHMVILNNVTYLFPVFGHSASNLGCEKS